MKLYSRTALICIFTSLLLSATLYCVCRHSLTAAFEKIEAASQAEHVSRVQSALAGLLDEQAVKLIDWAQWDETYEFMASRNPSFVSTNLNPPTLNTLNFDTVLFFANPEKLTFGTSAQTGKALMPSKQFVEPIRELLIAHRGTPFREIARIGGELHLIVAYPITSNDAKRPARGTMVATRRIAASVFETLTNRTNLKITFWNVDRLARSAETLSILNSLRSGQPFVAKSISTDYMHIYGLANDFKDEPALIFRIEETRTTNLIAEFVSRLLFEVLLAIAILTALALIFQFKASVSSRLLSLAKSVRAATAGNVEWDLKQKANGAMLARLTRRIFLTIFAAGAASLAAYYIIYSIGATQVDSSAMRENIEVAYRALHGRLDELKVKTVDYAQWDDSYHFIEKQNQKYRSENFTVDVFKKIKVGHMFFFDTNGKFIEGQSLIGDTISPVSDPLAAIIASVPALASAREPKSGFVNSPIGALYAAACPITDTNGTKPETGVLVFAAPVDDQATREVSKRAKLNVVIEDASFSQLDAPSEAQIIDGREIDGTLVIPDLLGGPVLKIHIRTARISALEGLAVLGMLPLLAALTCIICASASSAVYAKYVMGDLEKLGKETSNALHAHNVPNPSAPREDDEIAELYNQITALVHSLQNTRKELEESRTQALQAAKDANEAANHAKSNFVAKVSHELRTPIHSILGLVRIVRKGITDETTRSHLGMVRDSAIGLLGVVNDILDFSRSEAGLLSVNAQPIDLRNTIRSALRIIAPRVFERIESDPIECVASVDEALPDRIIGDGKRLSQILVNLIGNSLKFTSQGYVALYVRKISRSDGGDGIEFVVEDTGMGIPEEKLQAIFEPFQQVDDSVSRQYQGTGLGLTIVKQLVTAMGGTIRVESALNSGSRFIFELPLKTEQNASSVYVQDLRNSKVWIINNSELETVLVSQAFIQFGAVVTQHSTGSLRLLDPNQIEIAKIDKLVIAGNALASQRSWAILKKFIDLRGAQEVLISLSPHELTYREQLRGLSINNLILTPLISQETARIFTGNFKENFEGYDDFIDITPTSKKALEILIADDLVTNQIVLRCMLNDMGHRVTAVNNGEELLEALGARLGLRERNEKDKDYDVVLTDVQMPVLDGVSAVRRIREREDQLDLTENRRMPILLVTAHVLAEEQERIRGAGANSVITKPIDTKELELTIERLAERYGRQSQRSAVFSIDNSQENEIRGVMRSVDYIISAINEIEARINPHSSSEQPLIDTEILRERVNQDHSRFKIILDSYDLTLKALILGLQDALVNGKSDDIETHAHALKGCLSEIGCRPGMTAATDVVALSRRGERADAQKRALELLPIVQRAHQVVVESLSKIDC